ncbi:cation-transporting P-type ATPase [Kocuria himachalensis]
MSIPWHTRPTADVTGALDVDPVQGLSSEQVAERARRHGPNVLAEAARCRSGAWSWAWSRTG